MLALLCLQISSVALPLAAVYRKEHVPETCTTWGTYLRPSTAVIRATPAHAILCGSRATRMMQRFVRGEKYLTDARGRLQ